MLVLGQESKRVRVRVSEKKSELRCLARTCDFENVTTDQLIRDRIICGFRNEVLCEQLLQVDNLTLKQCIEICQTAEESKFQGTQIEALRDTGKPNREQLLDDVSFLRQSSQVSAQRSYVGVEKYPMENVTFVVGSISLLQRIAQHKARLAILRTVKPFCKQMSITIWCSGTDEALN